jgi:ferritin-like metal-binding protein YciE
MVYEVNGRVFIVKGTPFPYFTKIINMKRSDTNTKKFVVRAKVGVSKVFGPKEVDKELKAVFIRELKDLYYAEKHLVAELPIMTNASSSIELADSIRSHQIETQIHVDRLERIFRWLDLKAEEKKCEAVYGMLQEAGESIKETKSGSKARDVVIISFVQKLEHYEIATYATLRIIANVLRMPEVEKLLAETLREERKGDNMLAAIAQGFMRRNASADGQSDGRSFDL